MVRRMPATPMAPTPINSPTCRKSSATTAKPTRQTTISNMPMNRRGFMASGYVQNDSSSARRGGSRGGEVPGNHERRTRLPRNRNFRMTRTSNRIVAKEFLDGGEVGHPDQDDVGTFSKSIVDAEEEPGGLQKRLDDGGVLMTEPGNGYERVVICHFLARFESTAPPLSPSAPHASSAARATAMTCPAPIRV